jgi:hypothetical protein
MGEIKGLEWLQLLGGHRGTIGGRGGNRWREKGKGRYRHILLSHWLPLCRLSLFGTNYGEARERATARHPRL